MHWRDERTAWRLREAVRSRGLVPGLAVLSLAVSVTGAFLLVPGVDVDRVPGSQPIEELFGFDGPSASAAEAANRALLRTGSLGAERAEATVRRVRGARRVQGTGVVGLGGSEPGAALVGTWTGASAADDWAAPLAPLTGSQPGVGGPTGGGPGYPDTGPGYPDTGGVVPGAGGGDPPTEEPGSGPPDGGNEPDPVDTDEDEDAREAAEEAREEAREAAEEAREEARKAAEEARERAEEAREEAREAAEEAREEAEDSEEP